MNRLTEFPYENVLVLGLAKSGTAAARLLLDSGKHVRINDWKTNETDPVVSELKTMGAEVIVGSHPVSVLDNIEVIIKNPGIPYSNPILEEAVNRGLPILTEIELAGLLAGNRMICITGSNGKTTTTTLIGEMLKNSNQSIQVAGNIGTAASEIANKLQENEQLVLELSSFQLMGIDKFNPHIAVLLNIFEAHLDFHGTFDNYMEAKANIVKNHKATDYFIYNADDAIVSKIAESTPSIKVPFSIHEEQLDGAWMDEDAVYFKKEKIINRKDIVLVGEHNLENIMAAICAAKLSHASNEGIKKVLTSFAGVKHRLQFVEMIQGRFFYNDSKATNMLATEKALASFTKPTILLAGGLDRGNEFTDLMPHLKQVKAMIVFGETANKLQKTAKEAGIKVIEHAENVADAACKAFDISEAGDVILLSPACASWDQYKTFEQRGDMFIQAVHRLK
ncbi:UDP-N-acetylmuramoyl-L-alanine--D-glutamate ligase [Cerasibacillus terrae]|uniref:UDP-N-acetylmuramoylalanine--D-glutamate ligase n=1 Tax=Cerasibacillus terrae TaxID=2498845 RepID=A0A5C8P2D5_9BACI|nr:UDP-N-acetylmuramoyl-L-alanine--D-glutamate ligase [Cerasibacillus terrae]TXL67598.1 UDP-N-acetylmuramoyl-L-alanine--D-glutamate ligase [Cerasibacillus terrae]